MERKIWYLPFILLLALGLGGCSMQYSEEELREELKEKNQDLFLILNVAVAESVDLQTRALTGDDYFQQAVINTEKMSSLRILIVENRSNVAQNKIKYNYKETYTNAPRFITSGLKFKIDFECGYRIYLIANEEGLADEVQETLRNLQAERVYEDLDASLEEITLKADLGSTDKVLLDNTSTFLQGSAPKPVPMTEIFDVEPCPTPTGDPEYINVSLGKDVFVTRATTKFSFQIKKGEGVADAALKVKSIRIAGLGDKEFLFPKETVYSPVKDTPSTEPYGGREITSFGLPEGSDVGEFVFTLPENMSSIGTSGVEYAPQIYFTESKGNDEGGTFTCSISMDGEHYLDPVKLPNLDALPRNTHVKIIITIKNQSLKAEVALVPYIGCNLDPFFGLPEEEDASDNKDKEDESTKE